MRKGSRDAESRQREQRSAADALEADGRWLEAIARWSDLNRAAPSSEIETRLIALRHRAADAMGRPDPAPSWDRAYEDPFPQVRGRAPEVTRAGLTAEVLGGAIRHHGCLLVRGLLGAEVAVDLASTISRVFEALGAPASGSPDETSGWYAPDPVYTRRNPNPGLARAMVQGHGAIFAADSPRGFFEVVQALDAAGVPEIVAEYFGEPALATVDKFSLRRMHPQPAPAWHQDGSFLDDAVRTVDVWIALSECGESTESPGLEILPRRLEQLVECGAPGSRVQIEVLDDEVRRAGDGVLPVSPTFQPGDALLFDHLFLHTPGTGPGFTKDRYAIECWMFPPSSIQQSYVPILL